MAAAFRRFDIVERYLKNKRYCPAPGRSLRWPAQRMHAN